MTQMIDYDTIKNWPIEDVVQTYTMRDTILYALGLGFGEDPTDAGQLRFVYEKNLQAVPTLAAAIAWPKSWLRDPASGVDYVKTVHGEQDTRFLKPLPAEGAIRSKTRVSLVCDKGAGKGAVVEQVREILDEASGELLAQIRHIGFLRGDGGFSAANGRSDPPPPALPAVPERAPDIVVDLASLPQSALVYRLSGDSNPLHADPQVAEKAGFPRPILHGLCTYGMAARAALQSCCDYDAARLKRVATRFTAPVFPGETIRFEFWRASDDMLHLRARVDARGAVVLNNGVIELG